MTTITLKEQRAKTKALKQKRVHERDLEQIKQLSPDELYQNDDLPSWTDLNNLYNEGLGLIAGMGELPGILRREAVVTSPRADEVVAIVTTLTQDIKSFMTSLNTIKATHAGRTGTIDEKNDTSIDDLADMFHISHQYDTALVGFQNAVIPVFFDLQRIVEEIEGTTTDPVDG